jgi:alginate O-acetyltransferase complex protein AlgJ
VTCAAWGLAALGCPTSSAKYPWGDVSQSIKTEHTEVRTVSPDYQRTRSQVWVREVARPTRALLDYAAYHANFMIADPPPEAALRAGEAAKTSHPFAGKLDEATLTSDIGKTPLSESERRQPLAFAPLSEFLQSRKVAGAEALAEVGAAVREEKWGLSLPAGSAGQLLSELMVHTPASGSGELWAKVEVQPWLTPLAGLPDQDGDGFPELYGRVNLAGGEQPLLDAIRNDYVAPVLSPSEVKAWANQLSSYWYPSFNTDLMPLGARWPDEQTEPNIKQELGGREFDAPVMVLRGKPQGKPTYNVILIGGGSAAASEAPTKTAAPALKLPKTEPSPDTKTATRLLEQELATTGKGSWTRWSSQLSGFQASLKKRVRGMPRKVKALSGEDGFLFYKNSLEYVVGGDLEEQRKNKNPLPVIVEFKRELESLGVDFLFVPVPTKVEVYPEKLGADGQHLEVVNPYFRKFLLSLSKAGVEVVDLLPLFLAAKASPGAGEEPLLFQRQDTHWTDRGLRLAAERLSTRIKKYPWYPALARQGRPFTERETKFTRFGDLQSRLPAAEQKKYAPETLLAHQVLGPDGKLYDDDADSPVVLLSDSFGGVYQLTDAEHAGVSAHVARGISYPLDLVMSYGGGPNVRQKLMRRGRESLGTKKLVIWLMTARDLYNYWEDWESLKKP